MMNLQFYSDGDDIFSVGGCDILAYNSFQNSVMFQADIYYKLSHAMVIRPDTLSDHMPNQS